MTRMNSTTVRVKNYDLGIEDRKMVAKIVDDQHHILGI